ncbi:phage holin family protein [Enterococcus sp. AZ109]|uniref:phage holin family protein n=1 Tax=Enterococcus sp. AZ109 TaxID=2774634 RepID=UPI003F21EB80
MEKYLNELSIIFGVVGGIMVSYLGGMDAILHALIFLVVLDYITGLIKAWKQKAIDSEVGFIGLIKKVLLFAVVAVSVEAEKVLGSTIPLREIVIMFYLANEGISFLENISVFIPLPDKLRDVFLQIREKEEKQ